VDLREKSLRLAGRIIEFDPDVRGGQGYAIAREILESGRALEKMDRIIKAQGEKSNRPALGRLSFDVCASTSGTVTAIDNFFLARLARPFHPGPGSTCSASWGIGSSKENPCTACMPSFPPTMSLPVTL
jgi:thymidine phosphorylase